MSPSGEQKMRSDDKNRNVSYTKPLRVSVMGAGDVGKSALTVRYLTRRYIGEYRSDTDMLYKCVVSVDDESQPVEIMDTCSVNQRDFSDPHPRDISDAQLHWPDAFIIVYSVCDKYSFNWAMDLLETLSIRRPTAKIAVIGNKGDMDYAREVEELEGRTQSLSRGAKFYELSTVEKYDDVILAFNGFLKYVRDHVRSSHCSNFNRGSFGRQRRLSVSKMIGSLIGKNYNHNSPNDLIIVEKHEVVSPIREIKSPLETN